MRKVFSRRSVAAMSIAGILSPIAGKAQTTDQAAPVVTPPVPTPPVVNPLTNLVTAAPPSVAPTLGQIDKAKPYYLYFQRSIDLVSAKQLRDTLVKLVEAEVTDITLVLNSVGGLVAPTLQLYSLIRSLPITIKTHGQGLVASSATILILAGEERTAEKNTRFMLHAMSGSLVTQLNTPQFEEQIQMFHDQEEFFEQIYKERTGIPAADLAKSKHETVYYNADTATKNGIISKIVALKVPPKAKLVFFD
ncbi:MAG: ATP-dependent Clp protease proteolytic subunit [Alphaproteobacteria bacterium]|nr:ATP-dependent Clp protease proteolytic subunit [Alphaproteobacteria bacterium]